MTYFRGKYRSKNKLKGLEFEMVSLNLDMGKGWNDIKIII